MNTLIASYLFVIGLSLGSFALAVADRMHAKRDWVKGRSNCDNCGKTLQARDLVPVASWLAYRGACRRCGAKLSVLYPLMELAVGIVFLSSFVFWTEDLNSWQSITSFVVWLCAVVLMSILFIYDARWFKLPFKVVNPLIGLGLVWMALDVNQQGLDGSIVVSYILALLVGAGVFQLLYTLSRGKWIGDGDIRLGVAIGLFAGSPLEAWLVIFVASLIGLLLSLPSIVRAKSKSKMMKLKMPFGPPLLLALWVTVLFGAQVIEWYKVNFLYL